MEILLMKVSDKLTWLELEGYLGCLSAAKRRAIMKKKSDGDRINALLSQLLVLSELARRTGMPLRKIRFELGTHGKPYLKDSEAQFSLSHTGGAICAAFSDKDEIGVDIERKDRRVNENMYKRVLSEEEMFHLTSGADFLRFWVQKEAFLKRLGIGITRDLRGVNSLELPDTAVTEQDGYFIGASGKGAKDAAVRRITVDEVLARYVLEV
ncbi:MAG: 4'-phosphopantetheinyl transferase superfamily protein [Oscillospiraceae bacterium]|nr:4'-phosphopantetheinyl transferase superfamily protein [Oscillospiraceae bacterium]